MTVRMTRTPNWLGSTKSLGQPYLKAMVLIPILGIVLLIGALMWLRHWTNQRKRARLLAMPLTGEQRHMVAQLVPLTRRMPENLRRKLEGKINLFLDQITFHGMNGIVPNEPMRLSIAAQACLLVVNTDVW